MPRELYQHTNNSDIVNAYWLRAFDFNAAPITVDGVVEKQLPIGDDSKNNLIRARINIFYDESDSLAKRMFTGDISIGQWQEDMKSLIREVHTSAAAIGGGGWDEMSYAQWGRLGTPMREQYRYLKGFSEFIDENKDTISLRAIQARSRLYGEGAGGSTVLMQAGPVLERLLPFLPKDGSTQCLNRCACRWELEVIGKQPDGSNEVQATWLLGVADHCPDCLGRNGYVEMLVVPRDAEVPVVIGGIQ